MTMKKNLLLLCCLSMTLLLAPKGATAEQSALAVTRTFPEPHGETLCASGCALSRHPTAMLKRQRFDQLMLDYAGQPMSAESQALEELLFYGPQTVRFLNSSEKIGLDPERLAFLTTELKRERVKVEFRLLDDEGVVRVWMSPQTVPLDIRHVFHPLQTVDFQPPEASGTVKRVGLNHLWQRI